MIDAPASENQATTDGEKSTSSPGQLPRKDVISEPLDRSNTISKLTDIISAVVSKIDDQRFLFIIGISTILSLVIAVLAVNDRVGDMEAVVVFLLIAGLAVLALVLPHGSTAPHKRTSRRVGLLHQLILFIIGAIFSLSAATISLALFHWPPTFIESAINPSVSATATAITASIQPTVQAAVSATVSAAKDIVITSDYSDVIRQDGYYVLKPGQRVKVSLTPKQSRRVRWQIVSPLNPEFYFYPIESISSETELIIPESTRDRRVNALIKVSEYNEVRNAWSSEAVLASIVIE